MSHNIGKLVRGVDALFSSFFVSFWHLLRFNGPCNVNRTVYTDQSSAFWLGCRIFVTWKSFEIMHRLTQLPNS